ncbi:acyl carrier protein [Bradyrhizobium sp.]|uniref:acyl carrier protein n=1 Tax=Bradyrhizobium sp. TaxID=376 RepID=UPI003C7617CE
MTRDEVLERLTDVFRSIIDDDSIILTDTTTADDIEEWDSLNQIKIILASEQVFGLKLNARKINVLKNVGEMVDYVLSEASEQGKA